MIINKIKEFRKVKNLTQDDLAKELGVTRKTINHSFSISYNKQEKIGGIIVAERNYVF